MPSASQNTDYSLTEAQKAHFLEVSETTDYNTILNH